MVGGSVRDALLGKSSKDIDLEVHGLESPALEEVLRSVGPVQRVGRSFGVYKVGPGNDPIDVAIPRKAEPTPRSGHGEVHGDPHIGLQGACAGRDLTLNAILADPCTGQVEDPTGGVDDLRAGRLQAVDAVRFAEDPLRVIRVARFAATHQLTPTATLTALCRTIDTSTVASERLAGELIRALTHSPRPSVFAAVLQETGAWHTLFPGVPCSPELGPALDRAAGLRPRVGPSPRPLVLMLATTLSAAPMEVEPVLNHLRIHKREGFDVRQSTIEALRHSRRIADAAPDALDTRLRRAAEEVDVAVCIALAEASFDLEDGASIHQRAAQLGVLHAPLAPLIFGRDLVEAGLPRGPVLGELLSEVRSWQLDGRVDGPEGAMVLVQRLWTERQTPDV